MKKDRMTADNVDQLLEIVRAVQRGEDPAAALEKSKTESPRQADSPKSRPEKDSREWKKSGDGQEDREASDSASEEEDDFERILNEDTATAGAEAAAGKLSGSLKKAGSFLRGIPGSVKHRKTERKSEKETEEKEEKEEKEPEILDDSVEADQPSEKKKHFGQQKKERPAGDALLEDDLDFLDPEDEEEEEKSGFAWEKLIGWARRKREDVPEDEADQEEKVIRAEPAARPEKKVQQKAQGRTEDLRAADEKKKSRTEDLRAEDERKKSRMEDLCAEDEKKKSRTENLRAEDEKKKSRTEDLRTEDEKEKSHAEDLRAEDEKEKSRTENKKRTGRQGFSSVTGSLKDFFRERKEELSQKGIHNRELAMIGMGLLLAVLILLLVVNFVRTAVGERKKKEHVTADEGLSVTVENEPDEWCSSWPVELKFRAEGNVITKITVNGTSYQPDSEGMITVETSDYLLEATAVTEKGNLKARIEIPKLDAVEPVVYVQRDKDQIVLTAADARSSVRKIWYAILHGNDWIRIPHYQEYNGSIPYEDGALYYFYAQDAAGNSSTPVVTTMEQAQSLELEANEISMYPDEERYLSVSETPKGALLNNLRIESTNPEVVSVDNSGVMKALKEGSATIRVSADGVEQTACTVTVSRSRTVTISTIGDCTLGTDEAFNTTTSLNAYEAMYGSEWFFSNVKAILENDDVTFANFEGTLTAETTREPKEYAFKGDPSYTDILKEGSVEVVTLANNHSSDYGEQSLEDTKKYLTEAGIDYCTGDTIAMREVNGIKTAFIGIYVLNDGMARESQVRETISTAKEQGAQLVIVAFHWGSERATQPDTTQVSLAHTAVDCGADLVVGHHPHVLQGIEKYNGKYIVYSLANFCFGGNSAPSDMDTMIFRQTFTVSEGKVLDDDQIEIVPCQVSSAAGYNNYQPTPAQGSEAERIIGRVNEYSQAFGQSYTASSGLD